MTRSPSAGADGYPDALAAQRDPNEWGDALTVPADFGAAGLDGAPDDFGPGAVFGADALSAAGPGDAGAATRTDAEARLQAAAARAAEVASAQAAEIAAETLRESATPALSRAPTPVARAVPPQRAPVRRPSSSYRPPPPAQRPRARRKGAGIGLVWLLFIVASIVLSSVRSCTGHSDGGSLRAPTPAAVTASQAAGGQAGVAASMLGG